VEKARKLPEGAISQGIAALPGSLQALQGDTARLALEGRLVTASRPATSSARC
jgi:hypothetical protein